MAKAKAKRRPQIPPPVDLVPPSPLTKPSIGLPDPLEAAQEQARHALEGNRKLCLAIEAMRTGLETVVIAERDLRTDLPTTTKDLRGIAIAALDEYSRISGQNWRRHKVIGSWAGDRRLDNFEEG